jgi:hypothetical protein
MGRDRLDRYVGQFEKLRLRFRGPKFNLEKSGLPWQN